ncbi:MAG TPA: carboxypeptidase regulatory-like domain-containing protein [Kofleriaceae bacterium]
MKPRNLLLAAVLAILGLSALDVAAPRLARAQSSTSGAIQGVITDKTSGEKLAGATVTVTSPALGGQAQSQLTDENGFYKVNDLPPGIYLVTVFYGDVHIDVKEVPVGVGKVTPVYQAVDQTKMGGEQITITRPPPTIDPTSTTQGITLDTNYIQNIPVPGRTFDALLGAAAGSQNDGYGTSFSGSTSLENQYYVDGVNTTGLTYGTVGSPIVNDFIQEIEVITGGYNAEYGRATGGVVQVVTKTGSNEVKGTVFGYYQPGFLTAAAKVSPVNATPIDFAANINYDASFGFDLGGPIIKDKLWYYVGFAPSFHQDDFTRTTKSQTDCRKAVGAGITQGTQGVVIPGLSDCDPKMYRDGVADVDPRTGFYIVDQLDSEIRSQNYHTYNILAKLNYAATPEHQGQLTFSALPYGFQSPGLNGPANVGVQQSDLSTDLGAKWTSKFNDNKTEVEAIVSWHRENSSSDALDPSLENQPLQALIDGKLGIWGPGFGAESAKTNAGCFDEQNPNSTKDKYPLITNCPMDTRYYVTGGPGGIGRDTEQRFAARVSVTERFKLAGSHELKAGIDVEDNTTDHARLYSGGEFITNYVDPGQIYVDRWVQLAGQMGVIDNPDPTFFNQTCVTPSVGGGINKSLQFYCAYLSGVPGSRGTQVQGSTLNEAAYLRDSWQIRPNLTLNWGIRYEQQQLRYAKFLQNTTDPLTMQHLGTDAMDLSGMWAPRIGLLYDPTKEGRSKIYAHWGRFYESIPLDINERSFGGEVTYEQIYNSSQCGASDPKIGGQNGVNCSGLGGLENHLIGANGELIAPNTQAEYMDEYIAGTEYEILDDLKIGVSFQHRDFGRIIEDVSTDGANTYIIANPGEWSESDTESFQKKIDATTDPTQKAILQNELKQFKGISIFDHGSRDYNALQFTLTRRFSKKLYVQGSYTYSRTEGNYPGSISYDNGQIDPNISSQFDLIELLANRIGPLPQDRPHYVKLDGYYTFDFKKAGALTVGVRFRALSGVPENALAAHYLYGANESFLLPRGELGRTDFDHGLDLHAGYRKDLGRGMSLELFFDVFNIYDRQGTFNIDETYAPPVSLNCIPGPMVNCTGSPAGNPQNANPVSGGTYDDLIWVKSIDQTGKETQIPIGRNPNFGNTTSRYEPAYGRIGVRLSF